MQCKRAREIQHVQIDGKPVDQVLVQKAKKAKKAKPKRKISAKAKAAKAAKAKAKAKKAKPKNCKKARNCNEKQAGKGINTWSLFQSDFFSRNPSYQWSPDKEAAAWAYKLVKEDAGKWRDLCASAYATRQDNG